MRELRQGVPVSRLDHIVATCQTTHIRLQNCALDHRKGGGGQTVVACNILHGSRKELCPWHKEAIRENLGVPLCDLRTVLLTLVGCALRIQYTHSQSSCVWDTQSHLHVSTRRICCRGLGDTHILGESSKAPSSSARKAWYNAGHTGILPVPE